MPLLFFAPSERQEHRKRWVDTRKAVATQSGTPEVLIVIEN